MPSAGPCRHGPSKMAVATEKARISRYRPFVGPSVGKEMTSVPQETEVIDVSD